jgi:hypothetical protein
MGAAGANEVEPVGCLAGEVDDDALFPWTLRGPSIDDTKLNAQAVGEIRDTKDGSERI